MIRKTDKVLVTGGSGMLGKTLSKYLDGFFISSSTYDLRNKQAVNDLFSWYHPTVVIHAACRVGGILDNVTYPYEYFYDNVLINTNVVDACLRHKVEKMVAISSTCAYPGVAEKYPLTEDDLYLGPPEETHMGYGYTKRMMQVHLDVAAKQYGFSSSSVYLSNLYGPYDHFSSRSHLVSSLLKRMHLAKKANETEVELFGTGNPLRQFTFVDDAAKMILLIANSDFTGRWNVSTTETLSVKKIAEIVSDVLSFNGNIVFNGQLDGQFRKDVSIEKFEQHFGKYNFVSLKDGVKQTYEWFKMEIDD